MTDTPRSIDYAYNAQERIKVALKDPKTDNALVTALIAQAEATLALVEQQRVANLIALSQATNPDGSRVSPWALTHPVNEYDVAVNDGIREGLGL